jgi:hypothetical protein
MTMLGVMSLLGNQNTGIFTINIKNSGKFTIKIKIQFSSDDYLISQKTTHAFECKNKTLSIKFVHEQHTYQWIDNYTSFLLVTYHSIICITRGSCRCIARQPEHRYINKQELLTTRLCSHMHTPVELENRMHNGSTTSYSLLHDILLMYVQ